jgi:hypothetical protein
MRRARCEYVAGDALLRNPITGMADCCARVRVTRVIAVNP